MSNETVSLEVAIEVVMRNGPTFETIAGLCKMAVEAERKIIMDSLQKQADLATDGRESRCKRCQNIVRREKKAAKKGEKK